MKIHRTNYYDDVLKECKVVYPEEIKDDMFLVANENPDNWIVLIDEDVDHVTIFDKINKIAYSQSLKGYELLEANVLGYLKVIYISIEEYLDI